MELRLNQRCALVLTQGSTLKAEWAHATAKVAGSEIIKNVVLSGFFFYLYNELAFLVSSPPFRSSGVAEEESCC